MLAWGCSWCAEGFVVCICGVHLQTRTVPRCYYTSCLLGLPPEQNQLVSQCTGTDMHTENFITSANAHDINGGSMHSQHEQIRFGS